MSYGRHRVESKSQRTLLSPSNGWRVIRVAKCCEFWCGTLKSRLVVFLRFCGFWQSVQVSISPPPPTRKVPQGYAFYGRHRQFSKTVDGWSPRVLSEELLASQSAASFDGAWFCKFRDKIKEFTYLVLNSTQPHIVLNYNLLPKNAIISAMTDFIAVLGSKFIAN